MDAATAVIPARSERQAMDWSLVLLSQGIETIIEPPGEAHGWQLSLSAPELGRAHAALRQYLTENRRPAWVRAVPWTGLWFDGRSVVWLVLFCVLFGLSQTRLGLLRDAGMMSNEAVRAGQWWRLFTAVMLHADVAHLASNMTIGLVLLGLAMGSFGAGYAVLAAYLAGAAGNLASLLVYGAAHRGVGASGMVLGALGLLTAQSLAYGRLGGNMKLLVVRGMAAGCLLLILLGLNPDADVIAHVGGFVAGLCFGTLLVLSPSPPAQHTWANRLAELLCGGLMILTWALALTAYSR